MKDFIARLRIEQVELQEKLNKLNDFNQGDKVAELDSDHQDLLLVQAGAMYTYNEVLKARLNKL